MLTQLITPQILDWITKKAREGHPPQAVLDAMRASGWNEATAVAAIGRAQGGAREADPPRVRVPEPDETNTQVVLRTSDREVQVLMSLRWPRVLVFGGLLSTEECDELVELSRPAMERSTTLDNWSGTMQVTDYRSSESAFFERGANPLVARLEKRIAELVHWPLEYGEGLQILRYGPGAEYGSHHDFFDPSIPGSATMLPRGGQRVATLILYLRTPEQGGATAFPETGLQIAPVKGNAVFFSYDSPHRRTLTLHAGAPVLAGEKWIATKWFRENVFT